MRLRAGSLRAKVQDTHRGYFTAYVHTVSLPLLAIIFPCGFGGATTIIPLKSRNYKVSAAVGVSTAVLSLSELYWTLEQDPIWCVPVFFPIIGNDTEFSENPHSTSLVLVAIAYGRKEQSR
jgi:hypothetical protein